MITFNGSQKQFFKAYPKEKRSLKETYKLINSAGEIEYNFIGGLGEKCFKKFVKNDTELKEIENIKKQGITQEELATAKNITERDTHYARESVSNIASEMGYTVVLTGNPKDYDNYLKGIENVTADDVKRVANKYLGQNNCAISIVLPKNSQISAKKQEITQNKKSKR